ncbi:amino acid permease [candidate division KSB1 bacterium]|nr:amino acid permease [candidate division KSB1 bacterium]
MSETPGQTEKSPSAPQFKRELGLLSSIMIVMGSMIGSGIFIVSADIARTVGSPGYLLLVWLITGIMTIFGALSYGELAGMMPHAGGQYIYLREAYNPLIGFLYGWTLFLVIQTGTIAAVAVAFAKFSLVFFPVIEEDSILLSVLGINLTYAKSIAILSIVLLTYLNTRGLRTGKWVQNIFTSAKTLALLGLIVLGIFVGRNVVAMRANWGDFWTPTWTQVSNGIIENIEPLSGMMLMAAIGVAMVGSLFSSDAWHNIAFTAAEVKNPRRILPWSLFLGTATVTVLYLLANLGYIMTLPVKGQPDGADVLARGMQFAAADRVGTAAAQVIFGDAALLIMAALILVSTFGCNNGLILTGARVYYAMARNGLFFSKAGVLNTRAVPGTALVVQGVWASILCLTGTYSDLLDYVIFAVLIFYALTMIGIFILRIKRPNANRPFKAFGYPIVPALYVLAALAICIDLLIFKPAFTWPGMIIVLIGVPVYFAWRRFSSTRPEEDTQNSRDN